MTPSFRGKKAVSEKSVMIQALSTYLGMLIFVAK